MDGDERAELARRALAGYVHGPDAPQAAADRAEQKLATAHAAILVEGISDQIAIETLARRRGRDLDAEAVAVVPMGGAQAIGHHLRRLGPQGQYLILAGFCDADAIETFARGLVAAGLAGPERPRNPDDLAALGFHVCHRDLEDELIRAVGPAAVEAVLDSQGDLGSFRTFQKQPQWRGRPTGDQLRRFLGSKARRSLRYARLLIEAVDDDRVPPPLDAVLDTI